MDNFALLFPLIDMHLNTYRTTQWFIIIKWGYLLGCHVFELIFRPIHMKQGFWIRDLPGSKNWVRNSPSAKKSSQFIQQIFKVVLFICTHTPTKRIKIKHYPRQNVKKIQVKGCSFSFKQNFNTFQRIHNAFFVNVHLSAMYLVVWDIYLWFEIFIVSLALCGT
jgi:hypothetical protein